MNDVVQHDDEELKSVAADVRYEVQRLFQAALLFPKTAEEAGKRLLIEALLIHFRNTLDFFYTDSKNPDDVKASHFFTEPTQWQPEIPSWYKEYKERCNKLLAHLTYTRAEFKRRNEMRWVLEDKLEHLNSTWRAFLQKLPKDRRAWFN